MGWMEIVAALALVLFIVFLFPATRGMVRNSPKGTSSDWMSVVIPTIIIVLFITFLIKLV